MYGAQVALQASREAAESLEEVHFVLFGNQTFNIWKDEADSSYEVLS